MVYHEGRRAKLWSGSVEWITSVDKLVYSSSFVGLRDVDKLVHLQAELPLGVLEDVGDTELDGCLVRFALRLADEDRA